MSTVLRPCDLGAPEHYLSWRPGQDRAFQHLLDSQKRFDALALPTGVGKSLMGVLYAQLLGQRAVILTSTKGLQDQYNALFPGMVVDLRGMNNYDCALPSAAVMTAKGVRRPKCDEGPCLDGDPCVMFPQGDGTRVPGCPYYDAFEAAWRAPIVVTNYAMWFAMLGTMRHIGQRDVVVCDEAHDAFDQVTSAVGCVLNAEELEFPRDAAGWKVEEEWRSWAQEKGYQVRIALERSGSPRERRLLRNLGRRLGNLEQAQGDWVMAEGEERGLKTLTFEPLWPAPYTERMLWRGAAKVILLSATITPKLLDLLGIAAQERYWFECPSPFPVARRPIVHIPTIKINRNSSEGEMRIWVSRIDQIIAGRQDRKGIVHTVSYARAKFLKERSEHRGIMIVPRGGSETKAAVEEFKQAPAPRVLVSPSVHTGYDFPFDCIPETSRVLTADLRWVSAGALAAGDRLIGFDEHGHRCWRECTVVEAGRAVLPTYRVYLEDGRSLVASAGHKWLVGASSGQKWVRTDRLRPSNAGSDRRELGSRLRDVMPMWQENTSRLAGYLEGIADGEGYLAGGRGVRLGLTQKSGPTAERIKLALIEAGFQFGLHWDAPTDVEHVHLTGARHIARFLGEIRPQRLLAKFRPEMFGLLKTWINPLVVRLEYIGPAEVVTVGTTTHTLVVEGFASHNSARYQVIGKMPFPDTRDPITAARSKADDGYLLWAAITQMVQASGRVVRDEQDLGETFIVDDIVNAPWVIKKNKDHFPRWWLDAYRSQGVIPKPPQIEQE